MMPATAFPSSSDDEAHVSTARSFVRNILLIGGIAALSATAAPASAQALGDADCPGGYYYYPAYRICVPYGYTYVPDYYADGYAPPIYGPTYFFLRERRDHDRDRGHDQRRRHDDDHHRR
jgi:hypothetical protein